MDFTDVSSGPVKRSSTIIYRMLEILRQEGSEMQFTRESTKLSIFSLSRLNKKLVESKKTICCCGRRPQDFFISAAFFSTVSILFKFPLKNHQFYPRDS